MWEWSDTLQLAGGAAEIGGLIAVALGISARREFAGRQPWYAKVGRSLSGFLARLRPRKGETHQVSGTAVSKSHSLSAVLKQGYGFVGPIEERVQKLQTIAQDHENRLVAVQDELRIEVKARGRQYEELEHVIAALGKGLEDKMKEAAASELRLETLGVTLFILGVGFTTWGGIIS